MTIENPMHLDGMEFLEYSSPNPEVLAKQFKMLGMMATAKHKHKNITLYQQGEINFLLNAEPNSHAMEFAKLHGPSASAMGFRVKNAEYAYKRALELGAKPYEGEGVYKDLLAIYAIGDSLIYFIDMYGEHTIYEEDFLPIQDAGNDSVGLKRIDHFTHNVRQGNMDVWAHDFYGKLFNFREIRYFDIQGEQTGLVSRALRSPCDKITIPLNEGTDEKSQIEEFLQDFNGEGIQHIALSCDDIFQTVADLRENGIDFMPPPPATYYDMIDDRLPNHGEDVARIKSLDILIDGSVDDDKPLLLLQIFTKTMLGPVFFEIIQRKGDEGFGEGNFKVLFESIERDQINRGILPDKKAG